ncbi:MAG: cation:proton antiporter [Anaerolineaceae bacterium]
MSDFLQLAVILVIILIAAKLAGYLSTLIHQPAVFGELLIGVLLGPSLFNIINLPIITSTHLNDYISELGEIGVLLLMFLAGLELRLKDLARNTRVAAVSGILGVVLPVSLGLLFGELTGMDFNHSLFLGLTLGATSVSISAQVLIELKKIQSKVGLALLGAAVFDDVLVILLLSTFLALLSGGSNFIEIALVFVRMLVFLSLSIAFGLWVLPRLTRLVNRLPISQGVTTLAIIILLVYGLAAELLGGMAAITGTFIAGLMFARTPEKGIIESNLHSLAYAFFVPIFFVSIGLSVDLKSMDLNLLWIILGISAIAIIGKIIGAGGGSLLTHFSWREAIQLGIGMVSRGEVGLIIAKLGLDSGYLSARIFSAIVGMILITTLATPPLLRLAFNSEAKSLALQASSTADPDTKKENL